MYRFDVAQAVKGPLGGEVEIRAPELVDADDKPVANGVDAGVFAMLDGATFTTDSCGLTDPGALLAEADEPRGTWIKVADRHRHPRRRARYSLLRGCGAGVQLVSDVTPGSRCSAARHGCSRVRLAASALASRRGVRDACSSSGAGQMGAGIAQVVAASGRRVLLHDSAPGAVERGLEAIRRSLAKLAEKGGAEPDEVLSRVEPVDALAPADLMIEAVVEDAEVKKAIFRAADEALPADAPSSPRTRPRSRSPSSPRSRRGRIA